MISEFIKMKHKMKLEDMVQVALASFENSVYQYQFDYLKLNITNKYNQIVEGQIKDLSNELGQNISSYDLAQMQEVSVVEFYS
jgi:hypothetical protein